MQQNMNMAGSNKLKKKIVFADNLFKISKKQKRSLNIFWYGFLLYTLSFIFSITGTVPISPAACQGFQMVGLILIIIGALDLIRFRFDDKYLQTVFFIYIIYSLTIILRGFQTDYNFLKKMFFDPSFGMVPYFVPLVMLLPRKIEVYKKIFNVLFILGGGFLLFAIIYFNILHKPEWLNLESLAFTEIFFGLLAIPVGFILLTFIYHGDKKNLFALAVLIISLYFLIYRARRGSMFVCLTTLAGAGMVYLIYTKKKIMVIFVSVVLVLFITVFISGVKTPAMFDFFLARKDEDTRTGVEQYMKSDMSNKEWLIGKGIEGKYYCPIVINVVDQTYNRDVIETGYLQIILKGGILSLGLLLLILIPAVYKGFFKSENVLSKGAGMLILLWIVYLKPVIGTGVTMNYLLVWISVGICYSKKIRTLSDREIKAYLA